MIKQKRMKKLNLLLRFAETSFLFSVYINKRLSVNLFTLYCFIFQTIMFKQKENAVKVVKKDITFVCRWQQKQSPKTELFSYLLSKPLEETTFPDQPSSVYAMRDIQTELRSALQCICKTPYLDSARTDWTQISIWSAHSLDPSFRKRLDFLPQENQRHGPALISTYFHHRAVSPHRPGWRLEKSETGGAKHFVARMIEWSVSKQSSRSRHDEQLSSCCGSAAKYLVCQAVDWMNKSRF